MIWVGEAVTRENSNIQTFKKAGIPGLWKPPGILAVLADVTWRQNSKI
jgi:hypothetical protein